MILPNTVVTICLLHMWLQNNAMTAMLRYYIEMVILLFEMFFNFLGDQHCLYDTEVDYFRRHLPLDNWSTDVNVIEQIIREMDDVHILCVMTMQQFRVF